MNKIRYCIFTVRWLWKNRSWNGTRQKWKAMDRDWRRYERSREGNA